MPGHLIMAGLAGVQRRGFFIDILHVFTPVMTIKYDGAFMYQEKKKKRRRRRKV